jgi:sugar lactone lactonase YvrE
MNACVRRARSRASFTRVHTLACVAALLSCLASVGCSDDDDDAEVIAGDTGTISVLAEGLDVPTTVAVRAGNAWVPEGQFNALLSPMMSIPPALPFDVRSISLEGDGINSTSIRLPGDDFYPEGITAAPNGDLYVGSVFTGEIVKIPNASTTPVVFAPVGVMQRGATGLLVDEDRELLWACDTNLGDATKPGSALVGLSLDDGTVEVRHELPAVSFCNDILLEPDGDILFTETFAGRVYRIAAADALTPDSADVWLADATIEPPMPGTFGANGLALVGGRLFIAVTSKGTLVRVDPTAADPASTATVVNLTEGTTTNAPLSGPDGILRLSDDELLVVENGFAAPGNERLVKVTFDPE